jgi:phosphohistidine swiveling domain-containing protein
LYQQDLAAHCSVPVATSALLQVPMVARVLPKGKRPGILTFSAESLTMHHLAAVGIDPDTPVVGLPQRRRFSARSAKATIPFRSRCSKNEVLDTAERMLEDDPSIGAIVCECTNITPYSYEINRRLGVPVFDMVTLVHWFHRALRPQHFPQD